MVYYKKINNSIHQNIIFKNNIHYKKLKKIYLVIIAYLVKSYFKVTMKQKSAYFTKKKIESKIITEIENGVATMVQ